MLTTDFGELLVVSFLLMFLRHVLYFIWLEHGLSIVLSLVLIVVMVDVIIETLLSRLHTLRHL